MGAGAVNDPLLPPPPPGFEIIPPPVPGGAVPPPPPGFQVVAPGPEPVETWGDMLGRWGDNVSHGAAYLGQETVRGLANLAGAPVDLVNMSPMLLNLLPGEQGMTPLTENPVGGGQSIYDALFAAPRDTLAEAVGAPAGDMTAESPALRIAGRIANEVGATALPVAGLVRAGRSLGVEGARAMQETGGRAKRQLGSLLEPYAVNPTQAATRDFTVALGAGTGAGLANEAVPDSPMADFTGALIGSTATGIGGAALRTGRDTLAAVSGTGGDSVVQDAVASIVGDAVDAPLAPSGARDTSGLAARLRAAKAPEIAGFQPSAADMAQDPGLAALEYSRASGPSGGLFAQRRAANAASANSAIENLAPDATPGAYRSAAEAERARIMAEIEDYLARSAEEAETAAAAVRPTMSAEARGQTMRLDLDDAQTAARAAERNAWAGVQGEIDPAPLADMFDEISAGLTESETRVISDAVAATRTPRGLTPDVPEGPVPSSVLGPDGRPFMRQPEAVSSLTDLDQITTLRSELTTAAAAAKAARDPNKARIIEKYVTAIDRYLDSVPNIAEALAGARAASFDFNERFTRPGSPITEALRVNAGRGPAIPDSRVVPPFIQRDTGQVSNIDAALREAPGTRKLLVDQVYEETAPLLNDPRRLTGYMDERKGVMDRLPEARAGLETAGAKRATALAAEKSKTAAEKTLGPQGTSTVARYLRFGDERAVDAISGVINAADPAKATDELLAFVADDPRAVEGARSAFWQLLRREARSRGATTRGPGGEQPWRFSSLYNFVSDPKTAAVMDRLYRDKPEHLANIRTLAEDLRTMDFRLTGKAPNSSGTPQVLRGNDVLPSAETLGSRAFAYQRGVVGGPFIALSLGSVMARRAVLKGRTAQYNKLLDEALLNPNLMATLVEEANPANAAAMNRVAKAHFGVRSAWIDDLMADDEDGEEDPILEAIMGGQR